MERIGNINVGRILWCCADFGIAPEDLAREAHISSATLHALLEGSAGLTFNQLKKMADFFGRGVLFFLEEGEVEPTQVHTPAFRTLANQKPELTSRLKRFIERVEHQRDVYLSLIEEMRVDRPEFNPPDVGGMTPANAAIAIRRWLGLGATNNFDTYREAVEAKGILVFRSNGYQGQWQIAKESPIIGFNLYDDSCPVIVVKKQPWETQQSFTLMHELGHLVLHKKSSIDEERDLYSHHGMESEANAFAGSLLVPLSFLHDINLAEKPNDVSQFDVWLDRYRKRWGVSPEVILRRLLDNNKLTPAEYNGYRDWREQQSYPEAEGGSRQYRHREPTHIFGEPFVRTVLDSLNNKYITLTKASKYLDGINLTDIRLLRDYHARH